MEPLTLKQAILQQYNLNEQGFEKFVLKRTLFLRVRMVQPFVEIVHPEFLFNERQLIKNVGKTTRLREVQEEVDFYQHKYVVNYLMKEALKFRLSGMKLIKFAHKVFSEADEIPPSRTVTASQDSPNP